ncbi:MAG: 4Fe-4S binding protein, partial [Promethearchaeota archaeon]
MLKIDLQTCTGCKNCERVCPFGAIIVVDEKAQVQDNCTLCGACINVCPHDSLSIDRPQPSKEELTQYKGVFVFAELESSGKNVKRVVLELLAKGRELADKLEQELVAVLLGRDINVIGSTLIAHGADRVICAQHELLENYATESYTNVITAVITQFKPSILLLGATINGRDLGPRIAARLRLGLTADCTGLDIDDEQQLVQTRPAFGGNIMASIISPYTRPQMATVRPNTFSALLADSKKEGIIEDFQVNISKRAIRTKIIEAAEILDEEGMCIEEADIIVSVGRGIQSKENLTIAQELAFALNGIMASSR